MVISDTQDALYHRTLMSSNRWHTTWPLIDQWFVGWNDDID